MNYNTVYVGMDVHKESFTFCAYTLDAEKGSHFLFYYILLPIFHFLLSYFCQQDVKLRSNIFIIAVDKKRSCFQNVVLSWHNTFPQEKLN